MRYARGICVYICVCVSWTTYLKFTSTSHASHVDVYTPHTLTVPKGLKYRDPECRAKYRTYVIR